MNPYKAIDKAGQIVDGMLANIDMRRRRPLSLSDDAYDHLVNEVALHLRTRDRIVYQSLCVLCQIGEKLVRKGKFHPAKPRKSGRRVGPLQPCRAYHLRQVLN